MYRRYQILKIKLNQTDILRHPFTIWDKSFLSSLFLWLERKTDPCLRKLNFPVYDQIHHLTI